MIAFGRWGNKNPEYIWFFDRERILDSQTQNVLLDTSEQSHITRHFSGKSPQKSLNVSKSL